MHTILRTVAIVWCALAIPSVCIIVAQPGTHVVPTLIALLVTSVGIGFLWFAISRIGLAKRNGQVTIAMDPQQPRVGDPIALTVSLDPGAPQGRFVVSLVCENVGSGDDASSVLWHQDHSIAVHGSTFPCVFAPPPDLPASEAPIGSHRAWAVIVRFPDGKDERRFDIVLKEVDRGRHPQPEVRALPIPEELGCIVEGLSSWSIDYNPINVRKLSIVAAVVASLTGAIAVFLMTRDSRMTLVMGLAFAGVGAALCGLSLYLFTHHRRVEIRGDRVRVADRSLFGRRTQEFSAAEIRSLEPTLSMSTGDGTRTYPHYAIDAYLSDGRTVTLASHVREQGIVTALMNSMQDHLALPDGRIVSVADADQPHTMSAQCARSATDTLIARRIVFGLKILLVLILVAYVWDMISPLLPQSDATKPAADIQVER